MKILAWAIEKAGSEKGEKVKEQLYKLGDYKGASDLIEFDSTGDLKEASYEFNAVRNQTIGKE